MSIHTFKAALLQRYPNLFVRDDPDFVQGADELYIAGELHGDGSDLNERGERLFDYFAQGPGYVESNYFGGVHHEINDLAQLHDVFIEWRDCASLGVYPV